MITRSIRRTSIIVGVMALMAALLAPQAGATPVFSFATGIGQLEMPNGVAIDSEGNAWVVDSPNSRVRKFNSKGEYLSQFGSSGSGNGQFKTPVDIAFDSIGNMWVTDGSNNRVQKFNSKGEYLSQFGSSGSGNGQFKTPSGIAVDGGGNLWVVDYLNNRVQKFNSKGEYLTKFGSFGSGNGQFNVPGDIAIGSEGNVWVTDAVNNRVQKFNSKGEYLTKFGSFGSGNGQFKTPLGIATDSGGNLWVAEMGNNRVQEFNSKGEYLTKFGSQGSGNGQFQTPAFLNADASDNIWVTDRENNRVQKWTNTVTLAVNGEPMKPGDFIKGSSGNTRFQHPAGYQIDCPSVEFLGEVLINDKGPAQIRQLEHIEFPSICKRFPELFPYIKVTEETFEVGVGNSGRVEFFADETADLHTASFDFDISLGGAYASCKAQGSGNEDWASGAEESTLGFNLGISPITGASCPTQLGLEGALKLTDKNGTPIEILVE